MENFNAHKAYNKRVTDHFNAKYGGGTVKAAVKESYCNMIEALSDHIDVIERACKALRKTGYGSVIWSTSHA